jgi:hypothetical protein
MYTFCQVVEQSGWRHGEDYLVLDNCNYSDIMKVCVVMHGKRYAFGVSCFLCVDTKHVLVRDMCKCVMSVSVWYTVFCVPRSRAWAVCVCVSRVTSKP